MRSVQVNDVDYDNRKNYSDLMVLRSAAGYYIGTIYNNPEGFQEPGSRDSEYFASAREAHDALESGNWTQRWL